MSLNRYLIISVLTHILFLCILTVRYPVFIPDEDVFNINITGPIENEKNLIEPLVVPPPAIKHRTPPPEKTKPDQPYGSSSLPEDAKPDTIHEDIITEDTAIEPSDTTEIPSEEDSIFIHEPESTAPPWFLFDQKTIEKFAKKGHSVEKGLTFNTAEFKHRGYMRLLKEKIESVWRYPKEAAKLGVSGDLYIKFSIRRDGTIDEIELIRTSGYSNLDEAVTKALKKAEPYWPLPDDWEGETLEITGHFIYLFGSTYIM